MKVIAEESIFQVYSDLLNNEKDRLCDRILKNNRDNESVISKFSQDSKLSLTRNTMKFLEDDTHASLSFCESPIKKYFDFPEYKDNKHIVSKSFQLVQEWEGYVQEIYESNNLFSAILLDITAKEQFPTEEGDFGLENVSEFDKHLLRPGAVFRWVIGYALQRSLNKNGLVSVTKISSSSLVFRRMPRWSQTSLEKAVATANSFKNEINWE